MDCLITKLKSAATNNKLLQLGETRIYVSPTSDDNVANKIRFKVRSTKAQTITAIGGYFLDSETHQSTGSNTMDISKSPSLKTICTDDNVEYISIPDKNNISRLLLYDATIYLEQWQNCEKLTSIEYKLNSDPGSFNAHCIGSLVYLNGVLPEVPTTDVTAGRSLEFSGQDFGSSNDIYGSLSDLDNNAGFTTLNIRQGSNISGNVVDFINRYGTVIQGVYIRNTKQVIGSIDDIESLTLKSLSIRGTSVTGIVDTLAQKLVTLGKTSGKLTIDCTNANIMYLDTISGTYKPVPNSAVITFTGMGTGYSISVS